MSKIRYSLISARITVSLISSFSTIIYLLINRISDYKILVQSFSIFFITCAGFIYNDIYDYQKDKLAGKKRPICNDQLSITDAHIAAIIFLVLALIIPLLFKNIEGFILIFGIGLAVIFYSPFSKSFSLLKGLYTSLLCCSPIFYASILSNHYINISAYSVIICFITGREILLDIYDSKGDFKSGRKTIPAFLGIKKSLILSWFFMFVAFPLTLYFSNSNIWVLVNSVLAFSALLYCSYLPLTNEKRVVTITRVIIFLSSITLGFL